MQIRIVLLFIALSIAADGSRAGPAGLALPDPWSAAVAEQVLADGGNAVDAAVAAAFVLAVTYPQAGNIGGGGFLLGTFATSSAARRTFSIFASGRRRLPIAICTWMNRAGWYRS